MSAPSECPAMELARNGTVRVSVHSRPCAPAAEEYAAEELRRHLHEIAGVGPCQRFRFRAAEHRIFVNDRDAAAAARFDVPADLGNEEFLIETRGADIHILGGGPRGVLYGVYHLLETLGCRWFTPEISRIPKRRTLRLAPMSVRAKPAFEYRDNFNWDTGDPVWRARNRMNGWHTPLPDYMGGQVTYAPDTFVHTLFGYLNPRTAFSEHPEYAALCGGIRSPGANQLCLTNRDVLRLVTEAVIRRMRQYPWATLFSVSQMDGGGYCECPQCQAVVAEEGSQSGPILRFANAVAAETSKLFPDKLIDTLAYAYSVDAPRLVRPHPNVRVRLCSIGTCMAHPFGACDQPTSVAFLKALQDWSRLTPQLHIWHYCTDFAQYLLPLPDFDQIHGNIGLFRKHGVYGVFMQGSGDEGGGAESQALRGYLISRLLWNPDEPLWPLVDEFLAAWCGKASADVRKYYDGFHALAKTDRPHHFSLGEMADSRLFDEDLVRPADVALAAGEKKARGGQRFRVRLLRNGLAYARLMRALPKAYVCEGETYRPVTPEADPLNRTVEGLLRDWKRAGIAYLREGGPLEVQVAFMRRRLRAHPVVWLRDGDDAIAVTPTLCGRILEWHSAGRQWLAPSIPGDFGYPAPGGYMEIPGNIQEVFRCRRRRDGALVLTTRMADGFRMTRTLALRTGKLQIESRIRNESDKTVTWSWGGRTLLLAPGPADVSFESAGGAVTLPWAETPACWEGQHGAKAFEGERRPAGEWRFHFSGHTVIHRFNGEPFIRTTVGRDDARQGLCLYVCTDHVTSAPGEGIDVAQEFQIERKGIACM